ncbi:MAG: zinc ribbon domain-containing protein [Desulfovibrio sp.]|nr:MAG: zinc ribbon domain-containing protein [Desulfovibrio sp.]
MHCPHCNKENVPSAQFCINCGAPLATDGSGHSPTVPPKRRNGLGTASFILGLGSIVLWVVLALMLLSAMEASGDSSSPTISPLMMLVGLLAIATTLMGLAFAVAGLLQKNRCKGFAIVGLFINAAVALYMVLSILLSG